MYEGLVALTTGTKAREKEIAICDHAGSQLISQQGTKVVQGSLTFLLTKCRLHYAKDEIFLVVLPSLKGIKPVKLILWRMDQGLKTGPSLRNKKKT